MSGQRERPVAIQSEAVTPRTGTLYPEPFASMVAGRAKRVLGDLFGLGAFGVNLTRLAPGACSSMRHAHSHEDEFVFILEGTPTLVTNAGETELQPGMCAGFAAGSDDAHQLVNGGTSDVVYLEIGSRNADDTVDYPDDDLALQRIDGQYLYFHKDGQPY
jgi:uncharacterized cupin superfamily protein